MFFAFSKGVLSYNFIYLKLMRYKGKYVIKDYKTISTINRRKNIRPIVSVIFSSISLPKIFSRARNIKCPPSSAGIGEQVNNCKVYAYDCSKQQTIQHTISFNYIRTYFCNHNNTVHFRHGNFSL